MTRFQPITVDISYDHYNKIPCLPAPEMTELGNHMKFPRRYSTVCVCMCVCDVLVAVSALKRGDVPKRRRGPDALRPPYYLALSHGHLLRRSTWRLRIVPGSYRLRYICQRGRSLATVCRTAGMIHRRTVAALRTLYLSGGYNCHSTSILLPFD